MYAGGKRLDDLNAVGENNAQYAPKDGIHHGAQLTGTVMLHPIKFPGTGCNRNNLDRNYRYFAAEFLAQGRNFIV